jgi:hypothetical protein
MKNGTAYASGAQATFTFIPDDNGTYVVSLFVTDAAGDQSLVVQQTIVVDNVALTVSAGGPYTGTVGYAVTFAPTVKDPGLLDATAGFQYLWNFGDGTTRQARSPRARLHLAGHVHGDADSDGQGRRHDRHYDDGCHLLRQRKKAASALNPVLCWTQKCFSGPWVGVTGCPPTAEVLPHSESCGQSQ